tara:strand:+ start:292 stop:462 length:171 start_codon:yes stop_codon:yes gene_type:complete
MTFSFRNQFAEDIFNQTRMKDSGITTPEAITQLQLLHKEQAFCGAQLFPEGVRIAI